MTRTYRLDSEGRRERLLMLFAKREASTRSLLASDDHSRLAQAERRYCRSWHTLAEYKSLPCVVLFNSAREADPERIAYCEKRAAFHALTAGVYLQEQLPDDDLDEGLHGENPAELATARLYARQETLTMRAER